MDENEEAQVCSFCKGTGDCHNCEGNGSHVVRTGWLRLKQIVPCNACDGKGQCQLCRGRGKT